MNIHNAITRAIANDVVVTEKQYLNGKVFFCVICEKTRDAVIVDHVAGMAWKVEGLSRHYRQGDAIIEALHILLLKRNK